MMRSHCPNTETDTDTGNLTKNPMRSVLMSVSVQYEHQDTILIFYSSIY